MKPVVQHHLGDQRAPWQWRVRRAYRNGLVTGVLLALAGMLAILLLDARVPLSSGSTMQPAVLPPHNPPVVILAG